MNLEDSRLALPDDTVPMGSPSGAVPAGALCASPPAALPGSSFPGEPLSSVSGASLLLDPRLPRCAPRPAQDPLTPSLFTPFLAKRPWEPQRAGLAGAGRKTVVSKGGVRGPSPCPRVSVLGRSWASGRGADEHAPKTQPDLARPSAPGGGLGHSPAPPLGSVTTSLYHLLGNGFLKPLLIYA